AAVTSAQSSARSGAAIAGASALTGGAGIAAGGPSPRGASFVAHPASSAASATMATRDTRAPPWRSGLPHARRREEAAGASHIARVSITMQPREMRLLGARLDVHQHEMQ